jgi:MFS family permease
MGIIGGYVAHMWEMYGMRGWMVAFVAASLLVQKGDLSRAVSMSTYVIAWSTLLGAVAIATGGAISDRFGRIHTITVIMVGSGLLSLTLGWAIAVPYWLLAILCLLYGFMVAADSSVLSTGVVEMAHPGGLGRTMAIQSLLGWTAASVSPVVFGYILDVTNPADALARYGYFPNWGWAFMLLGVGGLMGLLAIGRSKKKVAS